MRQTMLALLALSVPLGSAAADLSKYEGTYDCQTLERWRPTSDDFAGTKVVVKRRGAVLQLSWTENHKKRALTTPALQRKKEGAHVLYESMEGPFVASFYPGAGRDENFNLSYTSEKDAVKMSCTKGHDEKPSAAENAKDQSAFYGSYKCAMFTRSKPSMFTSQTTVVKVAKAGKGVKLTWREKGKKSLRLPSLTRSGTHGNAGWSYAKTKRQPFAHTSVNLYLGMDKKHHLQFNKNDSKESYQGMCSK